MTIEELRQLCLILAVTLIFVSLLALGSGPCAHPECSESHKRVVARHRAEEKEQQERAAHDFWHRGMIVEECRFCATRERKDPQ